MKKIKLIFILLPLLFLLFLAKNSFALSNPNALFDFSKIVLQQKISASAKDVQLIALPPFTKIIIKPGTFTQDVILFVYKENFDNIKKALPSDQSPISSFYFMFRTTTGLPAIPLIPVNIQSYNNYTNTNTFYYPINSSQKLDNSNKRNWKGNVMANVDLPITDNGFIVATNKNLAKDDPALNVGVKIANPTGTNNSNELTQNSFLSQNFYIILLLIIIVISVIGIAFLLIKNPKKQTPKL